MRNDFGKIYSTDNDWTNQQGKTITVWPGTLLPKEQENDFLHFLEELGATAAEVVGSFNYDGITYLTFVCEPDGAFSLTRLQYGMRWWYDVFSEANGDFELEKLGDDFKAVIQKLGLTI